MDQVGAMSVFVQVAQLRSFAAAGRTLGISASAVGKSVARLEDRLGVRLLQRSTRSVMVTPEGALYLERVRRILAEVEMAGTELSQTAGSPRGLLRVSLPVVVDLFLPAISGFARAYPAIDLDVDFTNRQVDLIEEGTDVSIRSGDVQDSQLTSKLLGDFRMIVVGSPAYFSAHGTPQTPADLAAHRCLQLRMPQSGKLQAWLFREETHVDIAQAPRIICNDTPARVTFALEGLGIAYVPDFSVATALQAGRLVKILDDEVVGGSSFRALWPSSRHLTPKLRAFIDYMSANLLHPNLSITP